MFNKDKSMSKLHKYRHDILVLHREYELKYRSISTSDTFRNMPNLIFLYVTNEYGMMLDSG